MPNFDPVYLSINDKPRAVLSVMDRLRLQRSQQTEHYRRRRWLPLALLLGGFVFVCLDFGLDYNAMFFSVVGLGFWIAALTTYLALRRARPGGPLPDHFDTAGGLLHVLRDDLSPGRGFFGHLDLTGPEQPGKLAGEGRNALGLATAAYRDEWLSLKGKLYDGNMLRLSAVQRIKVRKGYYKRSRISGKQKWKTPKQKSLQMLAVRLSVNPNLYTLKTDPAALVGRRAGQYQIETFSAAGGIVELKASALSDKISSTDLLETLRLAYSVLQRKA